MIGELPEEAKAWPRVTEIIRGAGITGGWMPPQRYLDRGTKVHTACHYDDEGDLVDEDLDPQLRGYVLAWRRFRQDHSVRVMAIEQAVWHPGLRYRGRLDRLLEADFVPGRILGDIKTGDPADWHGVQLAAYQACLEGEWTRLGIYLKSNGTYRMKAYTDPRDWDRFAWAREQHNRAA